LDQAYVIVRAPIGNGLDITAGKFASLLGYEVDDRPANLNITYGYDYFFQTTHQTGVKLYYPVNDIIELQAAISNGSGVDTNSNNFGGLTNSTSGDGYGLNGTINIKAPGGNANIFNGVYVSDGDTNDGLASGVLPNGSVTDATFLWNTWGNWAPKFANDKLLLGFSNTIGASDYTFWNASLYAKYQFTDVFSLASRTSYLHSVDNDGASGLTFVPINGDIYSYTLTAGFNLLENLLVRAEYRIDLADESTNGVANTVSAQVVYTF
jgi:Putative beta-barrel porin-2, OmpL-like. bbp2